MASIQRLVHVIDVTTFQPVSIAKIQNNINFLFNASVIKNVAL
jgi:hypothetical protein